MKLAHQYGSHVVTNIRVYVFSAACERCISLDVVCAYVSTTCISLWLLSNQCTRLGLQFSKIPRPMHATSKDQGGNAMSACASKGFIWMPRFLDRHALPLEVCMQEVPLMISHYIARSLYMPVLVSTINILAHSCISSVLDHELSLSPD